MSARSRTAILNVVGLTPRVLGPDTPRLSALAAKGGLIRVKPVLPASSVSWPEPVFTMPPAPVSVPE